MPTDRALIDSLVADLAPVRRRRPARDAALLGALLGAEVLVFLLLRGLRPDMPHAMSVPSFWWKLGSFTTIAIAAAAAALAALDPAAGPPRLGRRLAIAVPLLLISGWLLDAGGTPLAARLDWRDGIACLVSIIVLALPLVGMLAVIIRRGAATRPAGTATAAGLAAAAAAAAVFGLHCGHDDPLYIVVWYGGAVALVAGLARLALPRLTRW